MLPGSPVSLTLPMTVAQAAVRRSPAAGSPGAGTAPVAGTAQAAGSPVAGSPGEGTAQAEGTGLAAGSHPAAQDSPVAGTHLAGKQS